MGPKLLIFICVFLPLVACPAVAFLGRALKHQVAWVALVFPLASTAALAGQEIFAGNCASCHGPNGTGSGDGPPLIHDIYNPGHHADAAFHRAVRIGTPQHHWPFGDMPAQPHVSQEQVVAIVKFVRELQESNGIHYREHNM